MVFPWSMYNMVWETMKYRIFLIYVTRANYLQASRRKTKIFIHSLKCQNKERGKILKKEAAEPYLEPCWISMMESFCKNATAKNFIIDVWYGCKHSPEIVQDSKINLKWMITKMLEKTVHFLNKRSCRTYFYAGISQDIRSNSSHITTSGS